MNLSDPVLRSEDPNSSELTGEVESALRDVLANPAFRNSAQLQSFLRYVVEHSLAGEDSLLRERVIGAAVFGRSPDYDTSDDPIVRIRAAEVRKRLAVVYQDPEFHAHVRIHIPLGSYRVQLNPPEPLRVTVEATHGELPDSDPRVVEAPKVATKAILLAARAVAAPRWWFLITLGLMAALAAGFFVEHTSVLRSFWAPFVNRGKPTLVVIGSNAVYRFSDEMTDRYAAEHGLQSQGMEFFMDLPEDGAVPAHDIHPAKRSFVALGDVQAVSLVVAELTQQGASFQDRFPNDTSFAELRRNPAILIGGFNNPTTLELTKNLRFVMADRNHILDRQTPGKEWTLWPVKNEHDNTEDYAILTRLTGDGETSPLLAVAGMGQYGTIGAAEFACTPSSMEALNLIAGRGWQKRNIQVVLHFHVADFKNNKPEIMAVHVW